MARFVQRWSAEQKAAIYAAVFDRGISAYQAHKLANAGELEDGLDAFPISASTVNQLVRNERQRRQVTAIKDAGPLSALDEVAAMITREVAEKAARLQRRRGKVTWNEWREAARTVQEVRKLLTAPTTPSLNATKTEDERDGAQRAAPTPQLVADLRKRQREDFRRERSDSEADGESTPAAAEPSSSGRIHAGL